MKVLITGGTGSLGSALVRRLLKDEAERIVVYSRDEWKQAQFAQDLGRGSASDPVLRFFLGDVRDLHRLEQAMHGCDTVIHTAALKRVDAVAYNPSEVRKTNIEGSANVTLAATWAGVAKVLMISSDKACMPTNVYGVSKAQMEHEAVAGNALTIPRGTRVSVVRYGNVLGSRGSVIHTWRAQAAQGLPLTLTHGEMTRFWIMMPQAVEFVLSSLQRMQGGEIFVPKLPAAWMLDLARAFAPEALLHIAEPRPGGEKIHEMLLTEEETARTLDLGDCYLVVPPLHPWTPREWQGTPVGSLRYTSDNAPCLSVEELRELLREL